jgi:peptidoglycan/LPS O-acetylase OafA/YrhL
LLYFASRPISLLVPGVFGDYLWDWVVTFAVSGLIACSIGIAPLARYLQKPPLAFLGKISYSLYLLHVIVLLSVIHFAGVRFGATVSLILTAVLIVPVSYMSYVFLERPGIRLGRLLARRISVQRRRGDAIVRN